MTQNMLQPTHNLKTSSVDKKFESMHPSLCSQQNLFKKANSENEAVTLVSIKVAYLLAKRGKPFMETSLKNV